MDLDNKYGTLEIQKELLELLKKFHAFAISNNIKYSLAYGTLLGAVRHKGFIPWDDDLDIVVEREQYDKLVDSIKSSRNLIMEREKENAFFLDRIRCVDSKYEGSYSPTIDVFILDSVPDNPLMSKIKMYSIFTLMGMMKPHLNLEKGSLILKTCTIVTFIIGKLFPYSIKYNWFQLVSKWGNSKKTNYLRCYNASFQDVHCLFLRSVMDKVYLSKFEDYEFNIMEGYDQFLTSRYGDYMTPPSIGEQAPKHL